MTYISWSIDFVKVDMLFVSVPALFAQSLVKEYYKYYTAKSLQTPHTFESLHIIALPIAIVAICAEK